MHHCSVGACTRRYNENDHSQTTWDDPFASQPAAAPAPAVQGTPAAPPTWMAATDSASGRTYWYDANNTSNVTWEDPTGGAVQPTPMVAGAPAQPQFMQADKPV